MTWHDICLVQPQAPGDVTVLTGAIRELNRAYPGQYRIWVEVQAFCEELLDHNPFVAPGKAPANVPRLSMFNDAVTRERILSGVHYVHAMTDLLAERIGRPIACHDARGDLYLSDAEKIKPDGLPDSYWLVNANVKPDMPMKDWGFANYQEVISRTRARIAWVQTGLLPLSIRRLDGAADWVGRTQSIRQYLRLAYHADGVLTPVSFPMHVAGAFGKRAVVIAGGREPSSWEGYPDHDYFERPSCIPGGCFVKEAPECKGGAKCFRAISPAEVAERILAHAPAVRAPTAAAPKPRAVVVIQGHSHPRSAAASARYHNPQAPIVLMGEGDFGDFPRRFPDIRHLRGDGLHAAVLLASTEGYDWAVVMRGDGVPDATDWVSAVAQGGSRDYGNVVALRVAESAGLAQVQALARGEPLPDGGAKLAYKAGINWNVDGRLGYGNPGKSGGQAVDCQPPPLAFGGRAPEPVATRRDPACGRGQGECGQRGAEQPDRRDRRDGEVGPLPSLPQVQILRYVDQPPAARPQASWRRKPRFAPAPKPPAAPPAALTGGETMYIAYNGHLEIGAFLGDTLTMLAAAWEMVRAERPARVVLSVVDPPDPLEFLWRKFIEENDATVIRDTLRRGSKAQVFGLFDQRRETRQVDGIPFDTYKELYPWMDCLHRMDRLCGGSRHAWEADGIIRLYVRGQEHYVEPGALSFGAGLIRATPWEPPAEPVVFVSPKEKCQGNRVFSYAFWESVIRALLDKGIKVHVNDNTKFLDGVAPKSYPPFPGLLDRLSTSSLVLGGNTGTMWAAAAAGVPQIICEAPNMGAPHYGAERNGLQGVVGILPGPDANRMVEMVEEALHGQPRTVGTSGA